MHFDYHNTVMICGYVSLFYLFYLVLEVCPVVVDEKSEM